MASDQFTFIPIADPAEPEESWKKWAADPLFISDTTESSDDPEILALLDHQQKWYLQSKYGGCSCHFRHAMGSFSPTTKEEYPPEFMAPADWYHEDQEDIESTLAVCGTISKLLADGFSVDMVNQWNGIGPDEIQTLEVSLQNVPNDHFRFFENYKFTLSI